MLEYLTLLVALVCGVSAGTITGLAPGIHINLIATILLASLPLPFPTLPISLAVFIVAMSITHTFIDFIPSIFLGAPEEDTFLSVLPGHQLLTEGKGYEAAILTLYGSLLALPIIIIFTPIFIFALPKFYSLIKTLIPFILIFISLFLIFRESNFIYGFIVFLFSGILGYLAFNLPVKQPLMPLLTGLFGLSTLLISIKSTPSPPPQKILPLKKIKLPKSTFLKTALAASIFSPLCSFLPGIGSGHAAVLSSETIKINNRSFLFLVGIINTVIMGLSFITAYSIGKTRTGSAAAVSDILKSFASSDLLVIIVAIIISGITAFFIGIKISKLFSRFLNKIDYYYLTISVVLILLVVNIIFTNLLGLLVLFTSVFLGIFCVSSGSRRINMMGCLLIPSILFYLTF